MGITSQNNSFSASGLWCSFPFSCHFQCPKSGPYIHTYMCSDMWWIPLKIFPPVTAALINKQKLSSGDKYMFQQLFHLPCLESSPVVRDYSQAFWTLVSSLSLSSLYQASHLTQLICNVLQGSWLCKCWRFWWWDCCPSVSCLLSFWLESHFSLALPFWSQCLKWNSTH